MLTTSPLWTTRAHRVTRVRRLHQNSFDDSLAVVTGAGSGIGAATALHLAEHGVRLALIDSDLSSVSETAAAVNSQGGAAKAYQCSVASWPAMSKLADEVVESFGPVDILINNAGVGMSGRFADMSAEDWQWVRSTNLDGVINGCRAFGIPMLNSGSGHVVNIASALGYMLRATEPAYVTTKAAVLAFSRSLRADWAARGIGVSTICPGVINTSIVANGRFLGDRASPKALRRTAALFSRGHSPAKVASAVCAAIASDRDVVPVGWEAHLGWHLQRLTPAAFDSRLARFDIV